MKVKIKVRPVAGLLVRKPAVDGGNLLDPSGEFVRDRTYWRRRITSGDVEIVLVPVKKSDAPKETAVEVTPMPKKNARKEG